MQAFENELREVDNPRHVACLLTQGEVDPDDPAFAELSGIARAALAQLGSVIGQAIRNNSLDRVVLVRVR